MSVTFVTGDLFQYPGLDAIAHGCNCAGAMGKGIAVEFRKRYPAMYAEYKKRCAEGRFNVGDVFTWKTGGLIVYNLGTEVHWRKGATLAGVEAAVRAMVAEAERDGVKTVGLPRIGAGYGGLEWSVVRATLQSIGDATAVELVVFETYAAAG